MPFPLRRHAISKIARNLAVTGAELLVVFWGRELLELFFVNFSRFFAIIPQATASESADTRQSFDHAKTANSAAYLHSSPNRTPPPEFPLYRSRLPPPLPKGSATNEFPQKSSPVSPFAYPPSNPTRFTTAT